MNLQGVATGVIVIGAFAYLFWKVGFAGRQRSKRGPDVPTSALVRKAHARRSPDKPKRGG